MTGIVGGERTGKSLRDAVEGLPHRVSQATWFHESDGIGVGIGYTEADEHGKITWNDGQRGGVVYGAVTNLDELGWSEKELFERLLDRPAKTAAAIEGSWAIACQDSTDDRQLLVTDKLGARPIFYTESGPLQFASSVSTLLPVVEEPSLNQQAVSDMLLIGTMWGAETLVEGIKSLYPATVLEVEGTDRTRKRYWKPEYSEKPPTDEYIQELARRYRQMTRRVYTTLPSESGIWLSGGLDSRTTASALLQHGNSNHATNLTAFTYNGNPPTNDNPELAAAVAQRLGIELRQIPLTAELIGENFERLIDVTDGMVRWNSTALLGTSYGTTLPPVMMEGIQGELLGDHLYQHHLTDFSSPVEAQLSADASADPETVSELLDAEVEPTATLEGEARRSTEPTTRGKIKDIHFQNYYGRHTLAGNRVMRDVGSSRTVHVDGEYLQWCAQLPLKFRKGGIPVPNSVNFTSEGAIPFGTSRAKLGLIREIDPELADVTYERTKVKPSRPYPIHVAGFFSNVVINRLLSNPTYGSESLVDIWIRDRDTLVHHHVTRLIDDACSRSLFNADAVRQVYDDHMDGENNASMLGQITTLEHWIGTHLD